MHIEHHRWYSPRLGHDMGVTVFGHWGPPLLAFPTSHGDEWELHRQGLIDAVGGFIDAGRVKVFCVGSNSQESFLNKGAHPFHRSWRQRMFDEYIHDEVFPFIYADTQSPGIPISTMGASLGAYHAANTLLRYPWQVKRCYALSGIYDLRDFMGGLYDENFYFHNPVDYMANLSGPGGLRPARIVRDPAGDRLGALGEEPLHLTRCRMCCRAKASRTPSTTGARAAGTTGPTGRTRCASTCGTGEASAAPVTHDSEARRLAANPSAPPPNRWFFAATS